MVGRTVARCVPAALLLWSCTNDTTTDGAGDTSISQPAATAADPVFVPNQSDQPSTAPRLPAEAIVLGVCEVANLNPQGTMCTGLDDAIECARSFCNVDACLNACDTFLQCVLASDDECTASSTCENPQPCLDCIAENLVCVWSDHCAGLFSCGSASEGGACDKLEACCNMQPDSTACVGFADAARMLSGDPFCQMLIDDPGFQKAYASQVACTF